MKNVIKSIGRKWKVWSGLLILGTLTGCAGGYGYYGDGGVDYGASGYPYDGGYYYDPGVFWGGDFYLHDHDRWGHQVDHDWARRGYESRSVAGVHGGFHGGVSGAHVGGGFHGGGGGAGHGGHR